MVVTRPAAQAENLSQAIEAAGGHVLRYPVIDILPVTDDALLRRRMSRLAGADMAIFISKNAVDHAYRKLSEHLLPDTVTRCAVGRATARALQRHGQPAHLQAPPPYDSEALLDLPELQAVAGRRIVIVRGEGGREHLADSLRERGADVAYAEVYRRRPVHGDPRPLYQAWEGGNLHAIVVTSNEGLQNLYDQIDAEHRPQLLQTPLVVIGERTARLAHELGFHGPIKIAASASDEGLMTALQSL